MAKISQKIHRFNQQPRGKPTGYDRRPGSQQSKLLGSILRFSLLSHIALDNAPIPPLADCCKIETIAPELSAPQVFLELGKSGEEFSGCDAFEYPNHICATKFWWKGSENMDMIFITADLFKVDVVALSDFPRNLFNRERDIIAKQRFAVFDGKNDVIVGIVSIVVCSDQSHASSLTLETNGFQTFLSGTHAASRGEITACII